MGALDEVTGQVFEKYKAALARYGDVFDGRMVRLVVSMALEDVKAALAGEAVGSALPDGRGSDRGSDGSGTQKEAEYRRQREWLLEQIERLNDWLAEYANDLYMESATDTATAMVKAADRLRGVVTRLGLELDVATAQARQSHGELVRMRVLLESSEAARAALVNEVEGLREQLAAVDADNSRLTQAQAQALVLARAHALALESSPESAPAAGLVWEGELADWVEGLEKGRHEWRKLGKDVRWRLIAGVVRQIPAGESAPSVWFDAHRPGWMSTARAAALTFGQGSWEQVMKMVKSEDVVR